MRRTTSLALALAPALALALALAAHQASAQPAPGTDTSVTPVMIGLQTRLHSAVLGEDRPVMVHLPRSYMTANSAYPVVYLLDGDAHFAAVSAMVDFLAQNNRAPEMIVVAVPNTRDRTHDLTPPADTGAVSFAVSPRDSITQRFPTAGGASKLRAFLTDELTPWVQSHYRTLPYRILVGHSFGGLFAVDVLANAPESFNAYVAISPSLWWDHGKYVKRVETALARTDLAGRALYMTTGAREPKESMIDPARELAAAIDARHLAGFRSWYRVMPTETHGSNPLRTEYDALERIFDGWEPSDSVSIAAQMRGDVAPLVAHRAALAKRYGFPVTLPPEEVNQLAYNLLSQKKLDAAVRLFRYNTEHSPDYANGWDSLADGLEARGDAAGALKAQEKAVQLGEAQKDPNVGQYREHLERLKKLSPR